MWNIQGQFCAREGFADLDPYDMKSKVELKSLYSFGVYVYKISKDGSEELYDSFDVTKRAITPTFIKELTVTRLDDLDMPVRVVFMDKTNYMDGMRMLCLVLKINGDENNLIRFCFERSSSIAMKKKSIDIKMFRSLILEFDNFNMQSIR